MKNKVFPLLLLIPFFLMGCTNTQNNELEEAQFNMQFTELNKEEKIAKFQISGYPTKEEEFAQVEKVIIDSMSKQKLTEKYQVNVYSDNQEPIGSQPFFGNCEYFDGKIIANKLNLSTESDYLG